MLPNNASGERVGLYPGIRYILKLQFDQIFFKKKILKYFHDEIGPHFPNLRTVVAQFLTKDGDGKMYLDKKFSIFSILISF